MGNAVVGTTERRDSPYGQAFAAENSALGYVF